MAKINLFKSINQYFILVNEKLEENGIFITVVETYNVRKQRLLNKFPFPFNRIYYTLDVLLTRVFPKLKWTKNLYYYLSVGKRRVLSQTETLGRLSFCGFSILKTEVINNQLYIIAQKTAQPVDKTNFPSYGVIIKLPRIGKNGKTIKVYKLRTMHAYSEYIQQYVFEQNNLKAGGKLNNDFRISTLGAFLRKYWIDELPMLYNWITGDLKLIGVRPLSKHYLSLYDEDLQHLRKKVKPGLMPPFYADMPKTLEEIQVSERKYLEMYLKSPIKTDCIYFFKIIHSILFRGKRSS